MKKKSQGYKLPRELEEQILWKLPVKSLVRFRSVCKSWKSLITGKEFVNNHLQANIQKTNSAFSDKNASSSVLVLNDRYFTEHQVSLHTIRDYTMTVEEIYTPEITGSEVEEYNLFNYHCNGIICRVGYLKSQRHQIVFYNPALREHRSFTIPAKIRVGNTTGHIAYGFGHDPETDDYKLVSIEDTGRSFKAKVYSLCSCLWREFEIDERCDGICPRGVYLKGRIYWVDMESMNMVSFDMSSESFGRLDLPPMDWDIDFEPWVMVRGQSLVCVTDTFEAWVMVAGDHWEKQFKIDVSLEMGKAWPVNALSLYVESLVSVNASDGDFARRWRKWMIQTGRLSEVQSPRQNIEENPKEAKE